MPMKKEFVNICNKLYEKEFVAAYDGNISVRLDSEKILVTPSGKNKGELTEQDLVVCDMDGKLIEGSGKVSTEVKIHLLVYSNRPEINSVVHCHPVYSTALASTIGFEVPVFPEVVLTLGKIPLCSYATPSTEALPESMLPYIEYANVFLLQNHGAVSVGKNLKDAYYKMEKLEHAAKSYCIAKSVGSLRALSPSELQELYDIAESTYGLRIDKRNKY